MKLKEFIKSCLDEFKRNQVFLINKGKIRTEVKNPNADLFNDDQIIKSWNAQEIIEEHGDYVITFFIDLE